MIRRLVFLSLVLGSAGALANLNNWSPVGPDGGSIAGVRYFASAASAVAVTLHGVYRTTDNGATWTRTISFADDAANQSVATNWNPPFGGYVLVTGIGSSIQRSPDFGQSWFSSVVTSSEAVTCVAYSRAGNVAWAGAEDGRMYRSADKGVTWALRSGGLGTSFRVEQIEVNAIDEDIAYIRSNGDLWRTLDGGLNWTQLNASEKYRHIAASRGTANLLLGIRATGNSPLYRSLDGGSTWTPTGQDDIQLMEFYPGTIGQALAIRSDQRVLYTEDDGTTWEQRGRLPLASPVQITFNPVIGPYALVATPTGMAYSIDGGLNWTTRHTGISELDADKLVARHDSSNYLYVRTHDDQLVWRRDPGTGAWSGIAEGASAVIGAYPGNEGSGLAASRAAPGTLIILNQGRAGRSINDSTSWQALGTTGDGHSLAFDPVNPLIAYAGGKDLAAVKTIDGGATWTPIGGGLPLGIDDIVIDPVNPLIVYAAKSSSGNATAAAVYKSINGGASWSPSGSGISDPWLWRLVMHPTQPATLYAGAESGVWRTTNSGASWSKIYTAPTGSSSVFDIDIDPVAPNIMYVSANVTPGNSARSVDGGATWESLRMTSFGTYNPASTHLALVPGAYSTLINARAKSGLQEFTVAPDVQLSTAATRLLVGTTQTVTFTLTNNGIFTATTVKLFVTLPTLATAPIMQSAVATCTNSAFTAECTLPLLRPGQSATIDFTLDAAVHAQPFEADALPYETDIFGNDNSIRLQTERRADLSVQLTSNVSSVQRDTNFTYTLSMTNIGPSPGSNVQSTITLPANATFVSVSSTGLSCGHAFGVVTCAASALAANATGTAVVTVNAVSAGNANATVVAIGDGVDPVSANNTASKSVTVSGSQSSSSGGGGGGRLDYLLIAVLLFIALSRTPSLRRRFPMCAAALKKR